VPPSSQSARTDSSVSLSRVVSARKKKKKDIVLAMEEEAKSVLFSIFRFFAQTSVIVNVLFQQSKLYEDK